MISWIHDNIWLKLILLLILILSTIWVIKRFTQNNTNAEIETFQTQPYVLKQNEDIYDSFYIDHYDTLFETEKYSEEDFNIILSNTILNKDSSILDIGCGTWSLVNRFGDAGFLAFGVDRSRSMVEEAQENVRNGEVHCDDVMINPMLYNKNSFTHILCSHFTIYEIEDKSKFFKHCHSWLKVGGYLGIHMVDVDSYKLIVPNSEWFSITSDDNVNSTKRIINTKIQKKGYQYTNQFEMRNDKPIMQVETFNVGSKTRVNEKKLYMVDKQNLIDMALAHGFRSYRVISYSSCVKDSHQYMVIFQKQFQNE